jgi:hypothetical protein
VACLLSDGSTIYDSTFTGELTSNSYQSVVGVGGDQGNYAISANVFTTSSAASVQACSLLLYFTVTLNVTNSPRRTCNPWQYCPCSSTTPARPQPTSYRSPKAEPST